MQGVKYLETDVYTEALKRVGNIYNSFDHVYVAFSGGKDSLVVLKLVEEYLDSIGDTQKIKVIFRDEELIPSTVLDFVEKFRVNPRYDFNYYCIQLESEKFILGNKYRYVQWDENRKHIREMPAFGITCPGKVFTQYSADMFSLRGVRGRIAVLTGVRAAESITRLRGVIQSAVPYISSADSHMKNKHLCKPIYDWSEKDVFKYFMEKKIEYCPIYDNQLFNKTPLRVSTPLHSERAKRLDQEKTLDPVFYNQIISVFPEVEVQARYYKDYKSGAGDVPYQYEHSWDGIMKYIKDTFTDPAMKINAINAVQARKRTRDRREKLHGPGLHGYPILHCFKEIVKGQFKRGISFIHRDLIKAEHYEYENLPVPENLKK
jgi:predicted phosphoadenosine phosphosulfate sulfurtransferase